MPELQKVVGPPVTSVRRAQAIDMLYSHPQFPKTARLADIEEENGKWVAYLKQADFPFSDDGKGGGPDDEDSGPPKKKKPFEGPNGDNDSEPADESDDSGPEDSSDSDSDSDSGSKDKKGDKGEIAQLKAVVDAIANALGIPIPGAEGDSPIPGADGLDSPDPGLGGPPSPPPPHGGPGGPGGDKFPKALKPGDAPPGATPVGAPAFASTKPQNPFPEHIGKQKAFEISDITNKPLGECVQEIKSMVEPFGYYIHQCKQTFTEEGNRRVAALVADHPPKH